MFSLTEFQAITKKKWLIKRSFLVTEKSWNFPYVRYRILRPLLKVYYKAFRALNKPAPWISPTSMLILKKAITRNMVGLEYGSGISTLFLSKLSKEIHSIEHYQPWYDKVTAELGHLKLSNVRLELIAPKQIKDLPDNPSKVEQHEIMYGHTYFDYKAYSDRVKDFPDEYFDFALIDGRDRVNCLKNTYAKVKSGGLIILDNSERPHYQEAHEFMQQHPRIFTTNGLTDTTIWIKSPPDSQH